MLAPGSSEACERNSFSEPRLCVFPYTEKCYILNLGHLLFFLMLRLPGAVANFCVSWLPPHLLGTVLRSLETLSPRHGVLTFTPDET